MKEGKSHKSEKRLAELTDQQREQAMARFIVLQPHLEEEATLAEAARMAAIPIRTAQRWLSRYHAAGVNGLARSTRIDAGHPKLATDIVKLIEGLALRKPRLSIAAIHRKVVNILEKQSERPPAYSTVYAIIRQLDPAMVVLAQEGDPAFRDQFELVYRHRAERPNQIWQADHTLLDLLIVDANGKTVRPWLTSILDDYSRAVAGYTLFLGAPSALQTSLALRQAIWHKSDINWPICGIPSKLYVDHGSDFTSKHLEQVAADLHFELIYSAVGRPQGRGKVERLFGTLNTELLPELPGHLKQGKVMTVPRLSFSELDAIIGQYFVQTYNDRVHSEIGCTPKKAWIGEGWLPNMPSSLENLDLLLVMVAKSRKVQRDGIHFQGLRYIDPVLAAYVGESVTLRYDPRDITEIRLFHHQRFLCRAVSPEHAGLTITLKDIQAARTQHRRFLKKGINERIAHVTDFLPTPPQQNQSPSKTIPTQQPITKKLYAYEEDKP